MKSNREKRRWGQRWVCYACKTSLGCPLRMGKCRSRRVHIERGGRSLRAILKLPYSKLAMQINIYIHIFVYTQISYTRHLSTHVCVCVWLIHVSYACRPHLFQFASRVWCTSDEMHVHNQARPLRRQSKWVESHLRSCQKELLRLRLNIIDGCLDGWKDEWMNDFA